MSNELVDDGGDVDPRVSTAYVSLPEAWQNALWYSDVEGLSPRHAAPLMGLASANAFSALRQRARAGLRSAYLTQVVDDACNEEVRRHLELLVAGKTTPETVDELVDQHLGECDRCGAIAWRIAAVTGTKMPIALAPALVAFHGFTANPALLPAGLGQVGLLGWWRRSSQSAAVTATAVVAIVTLMIGLMYAAGRGGDRDGADGSGTTTTTVADRAVVGTDAESAASTHARHSRDQHHDRPAPPTTTTTTSTTTTSTTTIDRAIGADRPDARRRRVVPAPTRRVATTTSSTTTTVAPTTRPARRRPWRRPHRPPPRPPRPPPRRRPRRATTTTTTTTTTTLAPVVPPGDLVIAEDRPSGPNRHLLIEITNLTGAPGTLSFSLPIDLRAQSTGLTCGATSCTFADVVAPDVVIGHIHTTPAPLTIELLDSSGAVVGSYTHPDRDPRRSRKLPAPASRSPPARPLSWGWRDHTAVMSPRWGCPQPQPRRGGSQSLRQLTATRQAICIMASTPRLSSSSEIRVVSPDSSKMSDTVIIASASMPWMAAIV